MRKRIIKTNILFLAILIFMVSCNSKTVDIQSGDLQIKFDEKLYSQVNSNQKEYEAFNKTFQLTEFLETKNFKTKGFKRYDLKKNPLDDEFGVGQETIIKGRWKDENNSIIKIVSVKTYEAFPNMALFDVSYINNGRQDLKVKKWTNHNYKIIAQKEEPDFWAFQGSSTANRDDWVKPVTKGYFQKNFMGMNQSDYGGGIPVTDLWRRNGGIAIGHCEMVPREVSLPVDYDQNSDFAQIGIEYEFEDFIDFNKGDTLSTYSTFVSIHSGDYFNSLRLYSEFMQKKGVKFVDTEDAAYESIWCGWGYMRKFTAEEFIGTLPKVKELGIKWAVIDDGFQIAEGDWRVDTKRFPGGEKDMKRMVDAIHNHGLKAKLWWAPMAADPGSKILEDKPEVLLINKTGAPQYITWWDSYYMSPASEATIKHTKETIKMFMQDWDFDGLKMDGQHMNAVPADYNWNRPLEYPEKSIEMLPEFFKMIYQTAREIKPNAVLENCPCGTCMSFYNMPYTNQTVSSDPLSSWQIRHKGKTYKALMPQIAYYGDHVELSDNASDFASSFGIGAVLGTKFTWPKDNPHVKESYLLTPEKEIIWKKWFSLYNEMMLSKETYLGNLYDIGFDKPETHVIEKGGVLYYAFYAKEWNSIIEFRGLSEDKEYKVYDYVNGIDMGTIIGSNPTLKVEFDNYLLVAVSEK